MTVRVLVAAGGLVACCLWLDAAHADERFAARLDTVPIDFRTQPAITGDGDVAAVLEGSELVISGAFSGLTGAATGAWLHVGAATGARGPAAHEIAVSPGVSGELSGAISLDRRELEALRGGRLYVQLHSQAAPEGNLWGWLLPEE
jgi:hypothetical protein